MAAILCEHSQKGLKCKHTLPESNENFEEWGSIGNEGELVPIPPLEYRYGGLMEGRLHFQRRLQGPSGGVKSFYNFCGDHMEGQFNKCMDCGGYMCKQVEADCTGCILLGTKDCIRPFCCLVCKLSH